VIITSGSRPRPTPLNLHLSHITPDGHPPYPPDSQAAAEEERARKKAGEDQAKEKVCLGTYPDVIPQPLHSQPLSILMYVRRRLVAVLQVLVFGFT